MGLSRKYNSRFNLIKKFAERNREGLGSSEGGYGSRGVSTSSWFRNRQRVCIIKWCYRPRRVQPAMREEPPFNDLCN
jgi:hypothetical protein